jgi:hypothetical protein
MANAGAKFLAVLLLVAPLTVSAQSDAGKTDVEKTRALFTGAWNRYPDLGEKPDPKFPPPAPIPPPPLKPEHLADWQARQKKTREMEARGEPVYTHYAACIPDGMPAMMMAMFPLEVLQTPGQITIIEEAYNQVRRIWLDQKQLEIADAEPGFWGHSVARWEGSTLVVDTVGIKERVRFRDAPHSDQMRISERMSMLSPDMFQNEVTITDPVYLTGPWTFTYMYKRKPGYKLYEYVCEDNRQYQDPETGGTRLRIDHK